MIVFTNFVCKKTKLLLKFHSKTVLTCKIPANDKRIAVYLIFITCYDLKCQKRSIQRIKILV